MLNLKVDTSKGFVDTHSMYSKNFRCAQISFARVLEEDLQAVLPALVLNMLPIYRSVIYLNKKLN